MRPERLIIAFVMGACTIAAAAARWRAHKRADCGWLVTFGAACISASLAPPLVVAWVTSVAVVLVASTFAALLIGGAIFDKDSVGLVAFPICAVLGLLAARGAIDNSSMQFINPGGGAVMALFSLIVLAETKAGTNWRRLWRTYRALRQPSAAWGWVLSEGSLAPYGRDLVGGAEVGAAFIEIGGESVMTSATLTVLGSALRPVLKVALAGGKEQVRATWKRKEVGGPATLQNGVSVAANQLVVSEYLPVGQAVTVLGVMQKNADGVIECTLPPSSEAAVFDCDLETAWRRSQADVVGATWYTLCALGYLLSQLFAHWL